MKYPSSGIMTPSSELIDPATLVPSAASPSTRLSRRRFLSAATGALAAGSAPPLTARAQSRSLERVNIVNASGNLTSTFDALMRQQGYFEKFGVTADPIYVSDGSKLMGSLLAGQMDLCPLAGFSQVFPAVERGATLKIINGSVVRGLQAVFTAKPEIRTVADLKGKTIGVGSLGAQLHETMVALLLKKGVDISTVTFANIGSSADVFRAVAAKVVDAGPAQVDFIPQQKKFGVRIVEGGQMWLDLAEYPYQGGFATDKAISQKHELLARALAAYAAMFRFLAGPNSRDAFLEARRKALGKTGPEFDEASDFEWRFIQSAQPFALDLILSPERIAYVQNLNLRLHVQRKILPYDAVADMSMAQAAIKLL